MARGLAVSSHRRRRQQAPDHDRRVLPAVLKKMSYAARSIHSFFTSANSTDSTTGTPALAFARAGTPAPAPTPDTTGPGGAPAPKRMKPLSGFFSASSAKQFAAQAEAERTRKALVALRTVPLDGPPSKELVEAMAHHCRTFVGARPKASFKKIASARQRTAAFLYYDQLMHRRCDAGGCAVRGSGPGQRSLRASSY